MSGVTYTVYNLLLHCGCTNQWALDWCHLLTQSVGRRWDELRFYCTVLQTVIPSAVMVLVQLLTRLAALTECFL